MGLICALGNGHKAVRDALRSGREDFLTSMPLRCRDASVPCGKVTEELPPLPPELQRFECRCHRLAFAALQQILPAVKASASHLGTGRIGVVTGSSTSGIDSTEAAFGTWRTGGSIPKNYDFVHQHEMGSAADFVRAVTGISGPCWSLSTACSSGAKVFAAGRSLLRLGLCDAVIIGGADALCFTTREGFDALHSLSEKRCLPFAAERDGLNLGEGAAFFLLTRETATVNLLGAGESSDAHHMNAPDPEGRGAEAAMREALTDAGLQPEDIGYLNFHGTATPLNDAMEAAACSRLFPEPVPCASTKPFTGHCLGAAGAIEAALCWLGLADNGVLTPWQLPSGTPDPGLPALHLVTRSDTPVRRKAWMSNSFAFGGSNCSLVLGRRA